MRKLITDLIDDIMGRKRCHQCGELAVGEFMWEGSQIVFPVCEYHLGIAQGAGAHWWRLK